MPRELSVQQSYQGWRRLEGRAGLAFLEFRDWTNAGHPFDPVKEDFMTYVIGLGDHDQLVPVRTYAKHRGVRSPANAWPDRETALSNLDRRDRVAAQITPNSTAFTFADSSEDLESFEQIAGTCSYTGREGIEFYPQELLLYRYVRPGPEPHLVWLRNIQVPRSKYRIPEREILVETEFLHPLVKGPQIHAFDHQYDGLIVPFPYEPSDPHRPIDRNGLREHSPKLLSLYEEYRDLIEAQTAFSDVIRGSDPGEFYGLARTGPYSFVDVHVAFRDNTKWRAAVVSSAVMPWGKEARCVFQNHAVSICERQDGSFIHDDEAHYIVAIFNAPSVVKFILASSDERSFKIRPPVHVPPYAESHPLHRRLSELSRTAHAAREADQGILEEIDRVYLELCREK